MLTAHTIGSKYREVEDLKVKEIAKLIRQHNDANILVLPGRFIDVQEALKCVDIFLTTKFEFGRHQIRIDKIGK